VRRWQAGCLFLHLKSDGEVINMPYCAFARRDFKQFCSNKSYSDFLRHLDYCLDHLLFSRCANAAHYYSCYVIFIGLMQFSLDGYFYQYFTPQVGFRTFSNFSLRVFSTFFLANMRRSFAYQDYSPLLDRLFNYLYLQSFRFFLGVFRARYFARLCSQCVGFDCLGFDRFVCSDFV
jgi:hypothetical protein